MKTGKFHFQGRRLGYVLGFAGWASLGVASAATFDVSSTGDASDAAPGDGLCRTAARQCTLRAAIEETNLLSGHDFIRVPAGTIRLGAPLIVLDSVNVTGAGAETTILDGQARTNVMEVRSQEVLVITGGDTISSFRLTGQLNSSPFVSEGSGGLEFGTGIFRDNGQLDYDFLVTSLTQGVLRFDSATGAFNGVIIPPAVPGVPTPLGAVAVSTGSLEVDSDLFVSSYQPGGGVLRFDAETGSFVEVFVPAGTGGLAFPGAMLWYRFFGEAQQDLLVVSAGTGSVLRFDGATGDFVETLVSAVGGPSGMIQWGGALLVGSTENDAVVAFDIETGAFLGQRVTTGSGGLDRPGSLQAFGGDLYVHSAGTSQILRYDGATGAFKGVAIDAATSGVGSLGAFTVLQERANNGGPIVNLRGLTLANGQTPQTGGPTAGLSVAAGASVTVSDSSIRDNHSSVWGGGLRNSGVTELRRVSVMNNSVTTALGGGGVTSTGGGIYSQGRLVIDSSTIALNEANRAGGIALTSGSADIINSTISGNEANGSGGGLYIVGDARAAVTFSTITENVANRTSDDSVREGGGIYLTSRFGLTLGNTIVAGNVDDSPTDQGNSPDCFTAAPATIDSARDNLIGVLESSCAFVASDPSTQFGTLAAPLDPGLEPLDDYGGPTQTHLLTEDSPAIDADHAVTSATFFDCRERDQRGEPRPFEQQSTCDIGAVELPDESLATSCVFASGALTLRDRARLFSDTYAGSFTFNFDTLLSGSIESAGNGSLRDRARISGDATLQGTLSGNEAGVQGTLLEGATVVAETLPARTVTAGSTNVDVTQGSRTLAPGAYGRVSVASGATLVLGLGQYQLASLSFAPGARLSAPGTGLVEVLVAGNVTLGDRWTVQGTSDTLSSDELLIYAGGTSFGIGFDARVTATLQAPAARLLVNDRAVVNGCLGAQTLEIGFDARAGEGAF